VSVRVLIADDEKLMRSGLRAILAAEADIEVAGEAGDGLEAIASAERLRPDVVLMDVRMPNLDGLAATERLLTRMKDVRVVMLTTFDLDEYVYEALRAGASGFVLKDAPADQLLTAIRVVAQGEALLAPSITRRLIAEYARRPRAAGRPEQLGELTERELDVMRLMAGGLSNAEIAEHLIVGEATIKTHVSRILAKLELRDRTQVVVLAYESGLVQPGNTEVDPR
jgi:DNA-binding NarL/FixJ family response regulator